jgi:nicotinamide-nucleotide amidase
MKVSFLAIGEEIISGFREEKNIRNSSAYLYSLGFSTYIQLVGDKKEDIKFALKQAENFSDIIICSGGLGSTEDDITRFAVSEYFNVPLEENKEALEYMKEKLKARTGKDNVPDILKIQCLIPAGSTPIFNKSGSAPGFKIEKNQKIFYFLPGVSQEFSEMFQNFVLREIKEKFPHIKSLEEKVFKIFGLTETQIQKYLKDIGIPESVKISYLPSFPEVTIRIIGEKNERFFQFCDKVKEELKNFIYSENDQDNISKVVGKILEEKGFSISTAESLTGGELANLITDTPGSSKYFKGGEIVYSNEAKIRLGVRREVIEKFGAVSYECAEEMAKAVREKYNSDFGLSTTGVAGPDPLEGKPPGLFYVGFSSKNETTAFEFKFNIGRKYTKILCSHLALKILLDKIK